MTVVVANGGRWLRQGSARCVSSASQQRHEHVVDEVFEEGRVAGLTDDEEPVHDHGRSNLREQVVCVRMESLLLRSLCRSTRNRAHPRSALSKG